MLIAGSEGFAAEADAVLVAGLETARWITVDDPGARHAGANQTCTQIGNARFAWFATRPSKSRLNFLELLQAARTGMTLVTGFASVTRPWLQALFCKNSFSGTLCKCGTGTPRYGAHCRASTRATAHEAPEDGAVWRKSHRAARR
jgi:hypothetical protein